MSVPSSPSRRIAALLSCAVALSLAGAAQAAAAPAPQAVTGGVEHLAATSAILTGEVNPRGQATAYYFQYGTTAAYGSQTTPASAGNGSSTVKVTQALTGLQGFTTYHYRLVAVGPGGTAVGLDRVFSTPKIPLSLQISASPDPLTFGQPFQVSGTLSGTDASTREVVLEAASYPYTEGFKAIGYPELAGSTGQFAFPALGVSENTQLRVSTVGTPAVTSAVVLEGVAVRVTLHVARTRRRGYVRLYGNITPSEPGALVGFQLEQGHGRSVNVGGTGAKAAGSSYATYSRVVRLRHRGTYRALVEIDDPAHLSAYSGPVVIG